MKEMRLFLSAVSKKTKISAGLLSGLMTTAASAALAVTIDGNGITLGEKFALFQSHRRWLSTPVVSLDDGRLVTLVDNGVIFSSDGMATWSGTLPILTSGMKNNHPGSSPSGSGTIYVHSSGKLVVAWRDPRRPDKLADYWSTEISGPVEGASGDIWVSSSPDKGLTWAMPQRVLNEPGGYSPKQIIESADGTLVMPMQYHRRSPGRNVIAVAYSINGGDSWNISSTLIDVGGHGHHDGALEPTLVALNDGRLWMLIRTGKDQLWQSFSADSGKVWSPPEPSGISSSSSPPYIGRLSDGCLLLIWNQWRDSSSGVTPWMRGGDNYFSELPTSWYRQELSSAVSADEGKSWSAPVIVARHVKSRGEITYPYFFETKEGNVLIFANEGKLEVQIKLADIPHPGTATGTQTD